MNVTDRCNEAHPPARSQLAFQIGLAKWDVTVRADTDRNAVVNEQDEDQKNQWSLARGAFLPVNQWLRDDLSRLSIHTITNMAPVVINPVGALPAGWTLNVAVSNNTNVVLVATNATGSGSLWRVGTGSASASLPVAWVMDGPLTLYAGATEDLSYFANKQDSVTRLEVRIQDEQGEEMARDEVAWQIAPIILAWNSLPLERLYCGSSFPLNVAHAKQGTARKPVPFQWFQDIMELGQSAMGAHYRVEELVNLNWGGNANRSRIADTVITNYMRPENPPHWHRATWPNDGNGGNIEVFPPYTEQRGRRWPLGRAVMSTQWIGALPKIQAQELQSPIVLTNVNWLSVGHVDELFSFLSDSEVLVADPELAWREILKMMMDSAVADKTIRVAYAVAPIPGVTNIVNELVNVMDPVNYFVLQTLPLIQTMHYLSPQLEVNEGVYFVGDRLLIDKEVMLVTNIQTNIVTSGGITTTNLTLRVNRTQYYGSVQQQHHPGALIRRLNPDVFVNVYPFNDSRNLVSRIDDTRTELQTKLGKRLTFRSVPVLFRFDGNDPVTGVSLYTASTANMVNGVFDPDPLPGTFYAASPDNMRFEQLCSNAVQRVVSFTRGLDTQWVWNSYHNYGGSLHCGSNGKRNMTGTNWWTMTQYQQWGQ